MKIHTRIFNIEDQISFAKLSGDWNPIHLDEVCSRREITGGVTVHGIHLVLWALDCWLSNQAKGILIEAVDIRFFKSVLLGQEISITIDKKKQSKTVLVLSVDEIAVCEIKFEHQINLENNFQKFLPVSKNNKPKNITEEKILGCGGKFGLSLDIKILEILFNNLVTHLSHTQISVFLASTKLVGMECPGHQSLFSELHLEQDNNSRKLDFSYNVKKYDPRFKLIEMGVLGPSIKGVVKAFIRPKPKIQPKSEKIKNLVESGRYSDQRALVIGGSRGIGEVISRILGIGGADVFLTYMNGEKDALIVTEDINSNGGKASCLQLDVTKLNYEAIKSIKKWRPTHIYYMATPFISIGQAGKFRQKTFFNFCNYYVTGFLEAFFTFKNESLRAVFYPSSVYLEEQKGEMSEYISAKYIGERTCLSLKKTHQSIEFFTPRLPKLTTDQTNSFMPFDEIEPLPVMIETLEKCFPKN